MKQNRFLGIFRHALAMARRNLRRYAFLSVTIVLSFSLLLGFFWYMDSSLYNEYKETFAINRGNLLYRAGEGTAAQFEALTRKASELPDTRFYVWRSSLLWITGERMETSEGNVLGSLPSNPCFLPRHVWQFFDHWLNQPVQIQWLDGQDREEIDLGRNQGIMDTGTFLALGLDQMEKPTYTLHLHMNFGGNYQIMDKEVEIIGLIDRSGSLFTREDGKLVYDSKYEPLLLLSEELMTKEELEEFTYPAAIVFYSQHPEQVDALAESLGYKPDPFHSVYQLQNEALEKIRIQKGTKAMIAGAMLLILGVNLYSSFTNALQERKFEIGVKRAMGASGFSIVRQFLYESLLVMAVNILISIAIVADIGLTFKLVMNHMHPKSNYILYLSGCSASMFVICTVTLTVVFSLIFAYQATQVEITKYLKAE